MHARKQTKVQKTNTLAATCMLVYKCTQHTKAKSYVKEENPFISSGDNSSAKLTAFNIVNTDLRKKMKGVKQVRICKEKVLSVFRGIMSTFSLSSSKCYNIKPHSTTRIKYIAYLKCKMYFLHQVVKAAQVQNTPNTVCAT